MCRVSVQPINQHTAAEVTLTEGNGVTRIVFQVNLMRDNSSSISCLGH